MSDLISHATTDLNPSTPRYRLSGDDGVGDFTPSDVNTATFRRLDATQLDVLRTLSGVTATACDVLDELGWHAAVAAGELAPRHAGGGLAVGQVQTLQYLPARRRPLHPGHEEVPPQLAHHVPFALSARGDVVVIDASSAPGISTIGGVAAHAAARAGLAALVIDGGMRDLDQVRAAGLAVWSRTVTPVSGKGRLEAVRVNRPVACAGVQVQPGDLALADATGICFVALDIAEVVIARVLEVSGAEDLPGAGVGPS